MAITSMMQGDTGPIGSTIEPETVSPPQEKTPGQVFSSLTDEERMLKEKFPTPPSGGGRARGPSPESMQRMQAVREKYEPMLSQPYDTFQPSKETAANFAGLGGLLMVMGAMSGSKGLVGATGAMNAMAGMLQGYQQGRQDLYEKERKAFETNFKVVQQNRALLKQEFDRALKEAQTDLSGATTRLSRRLKAAGASALAADVEKNGITTAAASVNQAGQSFDNQITTYQQAQQRLTQIAAEKKRLDDEAKAQRKATAIDRAAGIVPQRAAPAREPRENWYEVDGQPRRLTRAEADQLRQQGIGVKDIPTPSSAQPRPDTSMPAEVVVTYPDGRTETTMMTRSMLNQAVQSMAQGGPMVKIKSKEKPLEPTAKVKEDFNNQLRAQDDIQYLQEKLKDEDFRERLNSSRALTYLTFSGPALQTQLLQNSVDPDIIDFTIRANNYRNMYYRIMSGLAVTGGEAARNYSVVPQPGDSADFLDIKLNTNKKYVDESIQNLERVYPQFRVTPAPAAPAAAGQPVTVQSESEALALPKGTRFKLPDGRTGTVR